MREVTIVRNVYDFKELKEKVQENIISKIIDEIMVTTNFEKLDKHSNLYKAYKKAETTDTFWFLSNYIWQYCEKNILKLANENEYFSNGKVFCETDLEEIF